MNDVDVTLQSGEWWIQRATELIKQYRACKTAHAQRKLIPQIEELYNKGAFESRELGKLIGFNNEGEDWKNG